MLLPARYEGMDHRVEQLYSDCTLSIGDYVLMGGDLPAMVFLEGFLRFVPGVVGKQDSVEQDSFSGAFVDYPAYTAPVEWNGLKVPDILRSGNHAQINEYRKEQAAKDTVLNHFDWLKSHVNNKDDIQVARKFIPKHYVALMHTEVLLPNGSNSIVGTTSVTSMDIHDIARSSKTYGLENYFIVTPLVDQQKIVNTLLSFWQTGQGVDYNYQRHTALNNVILQDNLDEVIKNIEQKEGCKPILIATSAKQVEDIKNITFYDQQRVWQKNRPVLLILGTGKGLSEQLMSRCDYILAPINGFSDFNHLSVRSAAAIIFDRWLGINRINF